MSPRIVILGAGPTGLGAAHRLAELGHVEWEIHEREGYVGGLSASVRDERGFVWDYGGHVMFSHYAYVDDLVDQMLAGDYDQHVREAWVSIGGDFVPYPFQNNIHRLPPDIFLDCLMGVIDAQARSNSYENFSEYISSVFGEGIGRNFMFPYNFKVWAYPPEMLGTSWLGERVAPVDVRRILEHLLRDQNDVAWGPNDTFKFPLLGTGMLYERIAAALPRPVHFDSEVVGVHPDAKVVEFANGSTARYDKLVSTLPIPELLRRIPDVPPEVKGAVDGLQHTSGIFVGIGVREPTTSTKCWVYFPEPDIPFYRVTYLSNYSPNLTPEPGQFSLLAEVSVSEHRPENIETVVERTIAGLVRTNLLTRDQAEHKIVSRHLMQVSYSYPVPTRTRDRSLAVIQPWLMEQDIFSRGRFGAWRYEIGNTDHAIMMGVELADHLLTGAPERTWSNSRAN